VRFSAMPLFLCRALLSVPTSTSHLLSDTASVEQAALSSLYVPLMCCFEWFVCQKRCWLVVWMKVGLSSINSPTQASKALLFTRATATVDAIVPFEGPLTSVRLKYKWLVQPKLHQEISFWHPLPCHVLFQDGWGDYTVVYLGVFIFNFERT